MAILASLPSPPPPPPVQEMHTCDVTGSIMVVVKIMVGPCREADEDLTSPKSMTLLQLVKQVLFNVCYV